jgi:hypothetical protein
MNIKLPEFMTKVTPLSKGIALVLFAALPFAGFYGGVWYQKKTTSPKDVVYVEVGGEKEVSSAVVSGQLNNGTNVFYLNNDKDNYLELPDGWSIDTFGVKSASYDPNDTGVSRRFEESFVVTTLILHDSHNNKVVMQRYRISNFQGGCIVKPVYLEDKDIAVKPKDNPIRDSWQGGARFKTEKPNVFVYHKIRDITDGVDTFFGEHKENFVYSECEDGYMDTLFKYEGKEDGYKGADQIFIKNFLRKSPLQLIVKTEVEKVFQY